MKPFIVVGLGNPGNKFVGTRHNIGVDVLRHMSGIWKEQNQIVQDWHTTDSAEIFTAVLQNGRKIYGIFPLTFMNLSGRAVRPLVDMLNIAPENVYIIHDELEVPFGQWRWKEGGSAHGHNGVRSIQEVLGNMESPRFRIGIGRPSEGMPTDQFVLQRFSSEEQEVLKEQMPHVCQEIINRLESAEDVE